MLRYIILIPIDYYILPPKIPLSIQKVLPDRVGIHDDGGMHCPGCKFFCLNIGAYPCSRPFVQLWGIFLEDKRISQCQQWYQNSKTESQMFAKLKEQALDSFEWDIILKFGLKHSYRRKGHIICTFCQVRPHYFHC